MPQKMTQEQALKVLAEWTEGECVLVDDSPGLIVDLGVAEDDVLGYVPSMTLRVDPMEARDALAGERPYDTWEVCFYDGRWREGQSERALDVRRDEVTYEEWDKCPEE
jgi:hypothetical protein